MGLDCFSPSGGAQGGVERPPNSCLCWALRQSFRAPGACREDWGWEGQWEQRGPLRAMQATVPGTEHWRTVCVEVARCRVGVHPHASLCWGSRLSCKGSEGRGEALWA